MSGFTFTRALVCASLMACTFAVESAQAQERTDEPDSGASRPAVEITPFVSMGSARSSRIGAAIAFAWTNQLSVEAEMGYRREEGNLPFLNSTVSLLYATPRIGRAAPYLAAGVGLEQYGTVFSQPGVGVVTLRQTALSVNAGGGVKVPVNDRMAFRSDARWTKTFGRTGGEHWRLYNGMTVGAGKP